jgi:hypothetical protein
MTQRQGRGEFKKKKKKKEGIKSRHCKKKKDKQVSRKYPSLIRRATGG